MKSTLGQCGFLLLGMCFTHAVFADWHSDEQAIMGTSVAVTLWHEKPETGREAINAVMGVMRGIDQRYSPYIETSELSKLNREAAKAPVVVSSDLFYLIERSLYVSQMSDGAFDITYASLGRYYDYRKKQKPNETQKAELLPVINYKHVVLDPERRSVRYEHPQVYVDLGGIAKGFAVDKAIAELQARGIEHAMVSAGGDSRVLGDRRGRPWLVGIKTPREEFSSKDTLTLLPVENTAVSTSGDYERYFIDDETGERVHHIINPKTGSSTKGVVSVTILGDKGVDTDPLSTTVFVLGVEKGLALINALPEFDCVIFNEKGQAFYSNGLIDPTVNQGKSE